MMVTQITTMGVPLIVKQFNKISIVTPSQIQVNQQILNQNVITQNQLNSLYKPFTNKLNKIQ